MAKKTEIKGVPKVWIEMLTQSYTAKEFMRRADGTPRWFHHVQNGYNSERNPVFEEREDMKHADPDSYQKPGMVIGFRPGRPCNVWADNAAGLLVTGQAVWCTELNEESGLEEDQIIDQFCPEAHRELLEATAGGSA